MARKVSSQPQAAADGAAIRMDCASEGISRAPLRRSRTLQSVTIPTHPSLCMMVVIAHFSRPGQPVYLGR